MITITIQTDTGTVNRFEASDDRELVKVRKEAYIIRQRWYEGYPQIGNLRIVEEGSLD